MILDPRWRLDEIGQKTLGDKRKNKTKWVVVGFSVGSVDSVANLGWSGRAHIIRQSFTRNSRKNQSKATGRPATNRCPPRSAKRHSVSLPPVPSGSRWRHLDQ